MTRFDDLQVEPPIVDSLRVDEQSNAFVVTFVPSDGVSDEPKLTVTVPVASVEGRQIKNWLDEFSRLFSVGVPVSRIVHSSGGDFTFGFSDGSTCLSSDPDLDNGLTHRIYDGLQYVSQAAENAYRIVQVNLSRTA